MRTITRVLIISTLSTFMLPNLASARDGLHPEPTRSAEAFASSSPEPSSSPEVHKMGDAVARIKVEGGQFCSRFTDATGTVSSETSDRFNALATNFTNRTKKVHDDLDDVELKISKNRTESDTKLSTKFAELDAKATTADQKAAVAEYKASVSAAVTARRAAVDAANSTFKAGVVAAVSARQTQLKAAASAYKVAVVAALANAKAACASGTSALTVRANLKSSLDAARTTLEAARKNASKVGPNLDTLKATRKAAVEKANSDFKTAMKNALSKLKAALGVTPTPTSTPTSTQ